MHSLQVIHLRQREAVLKEFENAVRIGAHEYANRIEAANTDLHHHFEVIRFTIWQENHGSESLPAAV